jgi:uncharacterized protein (TIGR00251 family)
MGDKHYKHYDYSHKVDIKKYIINDLIKLKVIPNSSRNELIEENSGLKMYLRAVPDKNKANDELIKFFKKMYGLKVMIKSGMRSRMKVLRVDIS